MDGAGEIVVRGHEPCAFRHDPMPIVVCVTGESDVKTVFQLDQSCHRIGRRGIHADFAIPVDCHEAEGRIDIGVDNCEIQLVTIGDLLPVVNARASQWIDAHADLRFAEELQIDHILQIADVSQAVVVSMRRWGFEGAIQR